MENILELRSVKKKYDRFDLDMSFAVPRGSIVGLVGRNGSGKTTTIKLIAGAIYKDGGELKIFDNKIEELPIREKEKLAVCYDDLYLFNEFHAGDIRKIMKNIYKTWDDKHFEEYIERFDLNKKQKIKEYSRGMKMKLSIAIALSHATELLVLDESTSGLDPVVRAEILDMIRDFVQDESRSVLISSHITSDLEKVCDYLIFIEKGRVVLHKTITELEEEFAILKCSEEELQALDKEAVVSFQKGRFGIEALVYRKKVQGGVMDNASIEDILRFISMSEREVC